MQALRKGDLIIVCVYESNLATLYAHQDLNKEDMCDAMGVTQAGPTRNSNWSICIGDLFLVEVSPLDSLDMLIDTKKARDVIRKCGYYWEIRLDTVVPKRTKNKR